MVTVERSTQFSQVVSKHELDYCQADMISPLPWLKSPATAPEAWARRSQCGRGREASLSSVSFSSSWGDSLLSGAWSISSSGGRPRLVQRDRRQSAEPRKRPGRPLYNRGSDTRSRCRWGTAPCQLGVEAERRDSLGGHNHERPGTCLGVRGGSPRAGGEPHSSLFSGQEKDKGQLQVQSECDRSNDAAIPGHVADRDRTQHSDGARRQRIEGI